MSTANTTQPIIHASELLVCGCRVDIWSGARFVSCPAHSNLPAVNPLAKKDGMHPLCPECGSQRLVPRAFGDVECLECAATFMPEDIIGYGLSDDSEPQQCHLCNTIYHGVHDCSRTEA